MPALSHLECTANCVQIVVCSNIFCNIFHTFLLNETRICCLCFAYNVMSNTKPLKYEFGKQNHSVSV